MQNQANTIFFTTTHQTQHNLQQNPDEENRSDLNRLKQNEEISPMTLSNVAGVGEISLMQKEGELQQQTISGVEQIDTAGVETLPWNKDIETRIENWKEKENQNEGEPDKVGLMGLNQQKQEIFQGHFDTKEVDNETNQNMRRTKGKK